MSIKTLLREPFVHFFLIGVVLFGIDAVLRGKTETESKGEIVVTEGRIENLAAMFERTWQRPATAAELEGLVDSYIRDEALYRYGVEMGMDQDDTVIRRRVRQKLDFLIDDLAAPTEPEDSELQARLDENIEDYMIPARYTFYQIYLNPDRHGDSLGAAVERIFSEVQSANSDTDISSLGDATLLEPAFENYRSDLVANGFGGKFVDQLEAAPVGKWSGPYESAFGLHIVYMDAKSPAREPELDEVRDAVARDWRLDKREAAVSEFHEQAVSSYEVTVEWPDATEASE